MELLRYKRMIPLWVLILLLACSSQMGTRPLVPTVDAQATLYYVDGLNGSDTDSGRSRDQAWRTIQHAANTMAAGDTCIVLAGDYDERVLVAISGNAGAPITYQAEGTVTTQGFTVEADYITIKGFEITDTDNTWQDGVGIFVEGSHCVIEDNYVHFATRGGILIFAKPADAASTSDCLIRNNRLYRNAMSGIEINGKNHLVEGNEIWGTIQYHPKWTNPPNWVDADGMRFFGSGHLIRKNYIHDISFDDPENVDPHIDCFQTWENRPGEAGNNIIFEQNFCEVLEAQAYGENGVAFMLEGASHLIIRNNILQAHGLVNTGAGGNSYLSIVNNVMSSNPSFPLENHPGGVGLRDCPNTIVRNNIFYDLPAHIISVQGTSTQGLYVGHNLAYRSDGQALWGTPYPEDLWGVNPLFVDAAANDFHLQHTSPAIDAGYNLGSLVPDDYDHNPRPTGNDYDIGAFEFVPYLALRGLPADQALRLRWKVNTTLPSTSTWRIEYTEPTGVGSSPITGIANLTRDYTLTGLTNYTLYTVTLKAMLDGTPFLTDTIALFPTDIFVYLPIIVKNNNP